MFEKMRKTRDTGPFITRSNAKEEIERYGRNRVVLLHEDLHSVLERRPFHRIARNCGTLSDKRTRKQPQNQPHEPHGGSVTEYFWRCAEFRPLLFC